MNYQTKAIKGGILIKVSQRCNLKENQSKYASVEENLAKVKVLHFENFER
jgi:hypothetical protein